MGDALRLDQVAHAALLHILTLIQQLPRILKPIGVVEKVGLVGKLIVVNGLPQPVHVDRRELLVQLRGLVRCCELGLR